MDLITIKDPIKLKERIIVRFFIQQLGKFRILDLFYVFASTSFAVNKFEDLDTHIESLHFPFAVEETKKNLFNIKGERSRSDDDMAKKSCKKLFIFDAA